MYAVQVHVIHWAVLESNTSAVVVKVANAQTGGGIVAKSEIVRRRRALRTVVVNFARVERPGARRLAGAGH